MKKKVGQSKKQTKTSSLKKRKKPELLSTSKRSSPLLIDSKQKGRKISSKKKVSAKTKKRTRKRKNRPSQKRKKKGPLNQLLLEIGISLFVMVGLFLLLQSTLFLLPKVTGYGMTGTLEEGDRVFVYKKASIKRFDLVCFRNPTTKQLMFRRVIGLPEEEVAYENDELLINRSLIVEQFLKQEVAEAKAENRLFTENFHLADQTNVRTLPKDCYFVLGDNRPYAADSRQFGWIEKKDIIGVVKTRLFPLHTMTQF